MDKNIIYVPSSGELRKLVLKEMHTAPYAGNPGYQKTIAAVRRQFFWPGRKKYVFDYIASCMECERVKAEHRNPTGLLQRLPILEKKWEVVTIDFITKFPLTTRKYDSVMVVLDNLTKVAHFVPVKMTG